MDNVDFVTRNIEKLNSLERLEEEETKVPRDVMIEHARARREQLDRSARLRNLATLKRWDFIKDQRNQYE